MKLEKMTPGMRLHEHGRDGTIMRRRCSWPVTVREVDLKLRRVFASWNGNSPEWVWERRAVKWRKLSHWEAEQARASKVTP